ncbi:MAG: hypothetical protein PHS56_04705 [Eubacteriales bacterium]|nr:hypothetical protein [Eubacteriales bacterium]MDD3073716.1 hypothetical protein [Eubacteriales bacterium]
MSLQKGAFTVGLCFTSIVGTVKYNLLFINADLASATPGIADGYFSGIQSGLNFEFIADGAVA